MSFIYKIESCIEICIEKCVGRSLTSGSPWGLAILNVSFLHGFFNPFICVFSFFSQDISAAVISAWKKDEMRTTLKKVKKIVDDADKALKAACMQEVRLSVFLSVL